MCAVIAFVVYQIRARKREQVEDLAALAEAHAAGNMQGTRGNMDLGFLREVRHIAFSSVLLGKLACRGQHAGHAWQHEPGLLREVFVFDPLFLKMPWRPCGGGSCEPGIRVLLREVGWCCRHALGMKECSSWGGNGGQVGQRRRAPQRINAG